MNKITKKVLSTALVFPLLYANSLASAEKKLLPKWETMSPLQKTAAVGIPALGIGVVGAITIKVLHDRHLAKKNKTPKYNGQHEVPNTYTSDSPRREEPKKVVKPSEPAREESIDSMIAKIQRICSFNPEGLNYKDANNLVMFSSQFDEYHQADTWDLNSLKTYLQENDKARSKIAKDMKPLWALVSKSTMDTSAGNPLLGVSNSQFARDVIHHYADYYRNGNLNLKRTDFTRLVNSVHRHDGDLDLSFNKPFFDKSFVVPYMLKDVDEILREWGVKTKIIAGSDKIHESDLEEKLVEIIDRWFPGIKAEDDKQYAKRDPKTGELDPQLPITTHIFGVGKEDKDVTFTTHNDRFHSLIYDKKDTYSANSFVQILYSFENEAKRLGLKPGECKNPYNDRPTEMNSKKDRLKNFWCDAAQAFTEMSSGCCLQLKSAITKIVKAYTRYQLSTSSAKSSDSTPKIDEKFCQMLRDEASDNAVALCPKTKDDKGGPEYESMLRSTFTPLVNARKTGFIEEFRINNDDYGENYSSLATKWKDSASSFDLIKNVFSHVKTGFDQNESEQFENYKELPIRYSDFVTILKSVDKSSSQIWSRNIENELAKFEKYMNSDEAIKNAVRPGQKRAMFFKVLGIKLPVIGGINPNTKKRIITQQEAASIMEAAWGHATETQLQELEKSLGEPAQKEKAAVAEGLKKMREWMAGRVDISYNEFDELMYTNFTNCFHLNDKNNELAALLSDAKNTEALVYINHLAHDGLIVING